MPILFRREALQLILLVMVVPFQFWLTNELHQPPSFLKVIIDVKNMCFEFLEVNVMKFWTYVLQGIDKVLRIGHSVNINEGESPAEEVLQYRKQQQNMFASSSTPRYSRTPDIHFKVGDVVLHKQRKFRGVVVGWDYTALAPTEYLKEYYSTKEANQPNYLVAIDTRDRLNPQFTYTPDDNLELLKYVKIIHPSLDDYFEYFDGTRYVPRPWLQEIYPKD